MEAYPEQQRRNFDDIQRVSRILDLKAGRRLLDVGCSDGTITFMISRKWNCQEAYGVDINKSLIDKAKSTLATMPDLQGTVNFQTDFIEDLDFTNEYFDTISACETLEHIGLNQLEKAIKNLIRMLKPTGNMIITVPNRCLAHKYISEYRERWRYPTHHQFFNQFTLTYLLSPYFKTIEFIPLSDEDSTNEGIFLICQCTGKK